MTSGGRLIVLTAPLSEAVDAPNFILQMSMASLPTWMEFVLNLKYPNWQKVDRDPDGSASCMPAGLRVVQKALAREFDPDDIVACYPDDLDRFIGPRTRVVGVSTHNPIGATFAAGIFASIFGSSREPLNSRYANLMFDRLKRSPFRRQFKVIVGGTGGWQIVQTAAFDALGVDCVVDGRSESADTMALFHRAIAGEDLPRTIAVDHPAARDGILAPDKRTTFGAVEMTTGCGRRCRFCGPDLNPQLDIPKDRIMSAVRAIVDGGGKRVALATEDMFIWGQVKTNVPFFFPNREALVDLYGEIARTPGVEHMPLTHATIAPFVVDPTLITQLTDILLPKTPYHLPRSKDPQRRALIPLIGLETGSVRIARAIMPTKAVPFSIDDWPSVVLAGLEIANRHHWYPMLTLMVGSPQETDEDVKATLDLIYEIERRDLFGFLIPSIFTPLPETQMASKKGVTESRQLSRLQWQLIMKCWQFNLRPGQYNRWAPIAWRAGALLAWLLKLRRLNGPNSTWPVLMFTGLIPERWLERWGKIYVGGIKVTKSRDELIATLRDGHRQFVRPDVGADADAPGPVAAA